METLSLHPRHPPQIHPNNKPSDLLRLYEPLNVISRGAYGVVWRAKDRMTGEIVALKQELQGLSQSTIREMLILTSLPPHPRVVGFKRALQDDGGRVFVAMECLRTDLRRFLAEKRRPLGTAEVKLIVRQILEGVDHLHDNGVMHRDIKPANVLMNSVSDVKLCDFGLSRHMGSGSGQHTPGVVTLWYRAPEVLLGEERYTKAIDMWSVGCIMAELVINEVLLPGNSEIMQLRCIYDEIVWRGGDVLRHKVAAAAASSVGPVLTPHGLHLLQSLLAFEPGKRISAKDALTHFWFIE